MASMTIKKRYIYFHKVHEYQMWQIDGLCVLFTILFSASKSEGDSNIKIFIENQLPIETNQIHGLVTVSPIK